MTRMLALLTGLMLAAGTAAAQDKEANSKAGAEVGKPAPTFELKDTTGKAVKLDEFKDKLVVLEWVNRDCPYSNDTPNTGALPGMKDLQKAYAEKGVVWLAIDSTHGRKPEEMEQYRKDKGIGYTILMDADGTVGRTYGAKTTPHIFIVHKGELKYAGAHRTRSGDRNYIAETLDQLLEGKQPSLTSTKSFGCPIKYKG